MRIAVTSQNFKTVTGHAGKTRRFLIFETLADGALHEVDRLDLPKDKSIHETHPSEPHPLDNCDIVVTSSCGEGFPRKLARRNVKVVVSEISDPLEAAGLALKQ